MLHHTHSGQTQSVTTLRVYSDLHRRVYLSRPIDHFNSEPRPKRRHIVYSSFVLQLFECRRNKMENTNAFLATRSSAAPVMRQSRKQRADIGKASAAHKPYERPPTQCRCRKGRNFVRWSAGLTTHRGEPEVAAAAEAAVAAASIDALIASFGNFGLGKVTPEVCASMKDETSWRNAHRRRHRHPWRKIRLRPSLG